MIPCTNHYFLVGQILVCQWKWPPLTDVIFLHHRVLLFVSSEYWWTSKPWVQIYFSVRNFRILAAKVVFIMRKWWWGGEAFAEGKGKCCTSIFFWSLLPPPRQFCLINTTLWLCNLIYAFIARCKQIFRLKNSSLSQIQTMTSAIPVQCSTSWAISPAGSRLLCGSMTSPLMMVIYPFRVRIPFM